MSQFLDRLRTAWNSLTDAEGTDLLLCGPLPLWMQDRFEREAERQGVPVGHVIFEALAAAAETLPNGLEVKRV